MELIPITVECHAGFKADEYPKRFTWEGVVFEIIAILDRWYEAYDTPGNTIHYYKIQTNLSGTYMLRHEAESGHWFLVV